MAVERYVDKADFSAVITKVETKLTNRYTKAQTDSAISTAIAGVTQFDYQVVESLPATGVKGIIYLVPNSGSGSNLYNEYIWIVVDETGKFENLGQRDLDLSSYLVRSDVKQGTGITITPDETGNGFTISSHAATTVSDGTGIDVTQNGTDYEVALDSEAQTELAKAGTAVQKADIKGTANKIDVTPDAEGNGVTISLPDAIVNGAAAGATALQPADVEPLSETDLNEVLAILTDDPTSTPATD